MTRSAGLAIALSVLACASMIHPAAAPASLPPAKSALAGDWAGWAYFDGKAGDAPLRLRIEAGDSLSVRFDELTRRQYDLPASVMECDPPRIVLQRVRPNGQRIRLEGEARGDSITGRITWVDASGRFVLIRSGAPISRLSPDEFDDLQGCYRLAPDRILLIDSRRWGELLYSDLGTGRQGTLFPLDRDLFFVGGAMYVPRPVAARVQFSRDAQGKPQGVKWISSSGDTTAGTFVAFSEEEVAFNSDSIRLSGTLLRPPGHSRLPAAVILGGSDWTDRSLCRRDAGILASFGVATLIFDRRGHGRSSGAPVHSFADDAADALSAVRFLRGRPDLLENQIGLTGRSQGGWIAPLAAAARPDVAYLLLFVPPAVPPAEQELTRRTRVLSGRGFPASAISQERRLMDLAWEYSVHRAGWESYLAARNSAQSAGFPEDVLESDKPDDPDWEWDRLNWRYDPIPALEKVRCPVLALFGGADRNVVPEDNLPPMRRALKKAGNRDVTLLVVPGANHGLVTVSPESVPLHRLTGIGDQGWPQVQRWLAAHLSLDGAR